MASSKSTLSGGRWVTIEHEHVYIKGGKIAAGHVPSNTSKSTKSDAEKWIEAGHATKMFQSDDEVRPTSHGYDHVRGHEEAYEKYAQEYDDRKDLTPLHRAAVSNYVGAGYYKMNKLLHDKGADFNPDKLGDEDNTVEDVRLVHEAIKRSPAADEDHILYRHFTHDPDHKVGDEVKTVGFLSSSKLSQDGFMGKNGKTGKGYGYEIAVPKGSKGLLTGINAGEDETLIGHGVKFKVLGKKELKFKGHFGDETRTIYQLGYLGPQHT